MLNFLLTLGNTGRPSKLHLLQRYCEGFHAFVIAIGYEIQFLQGHSKQFWSGPARGCGLSSTLKPRPLYGHSGTVVDVTLQCSFLVSLLTLQHLMQTNTVGVAVKLHLKPRRVSCSKWELEPAQCHVSLLHTCRSSHLRALFVKKKFSLHSFVLMVVLDESLFSVNFPHSMHTLISNLDYLHYHLSNCFSLATGRN